MSTSIDEVANRVLLTVATARASARASGYAQADEIGADAERLARHVLDGPRIDQYQQALQRILAHLRGALREVAAVCPDELGRDSVHVYTCSCLQPGAGASVVCGGSGEHDPACPCSCHWAASGVDSVSPARTPAADPRQLTMPGVEPPVERPAQVEAKPAAPPARQRAEEPEIAIEDWKPEPMWISSMQTAIEDTAAVERHLARFRAEKAGQKARRWPSVFRSWLKAAREGSR